MLRGLEMESYKMLKTRESRQMGGKETKSKCSEQKRVTNMADINTTT